MGNIVLRHRITGTHYLPVTGHSKHAVPGFGPDDSIVQVLVRPLSGDAPVWLPESELETVPGMTGRFIQTRKEQARSFVIDMVCTLALAIPVQDRLMGHGVSGWESALYATFSALTVVRIALGAVRSQKG